MGVAGSIANNETIKFVEQQQDNSSLVEQNSYQEYRSHFSGQYVGGRTGGWNQHIPIFNKDSEMIGGVNPNNSLFQYHADKGEIQILQDVESIEFDIWIQGHAPYGYIYIILFHKHGDDTSNEKSENCENQQGHLNIKLKAKANDIFHITTMPAHIKGPPIISTLRVTAHIKDTSLPKPNDGEQLRSKVKDFLNLQDFQSIKKLLQSLTKETIEELQQPSVIDGSTIAESLSSLSTENNPVIFALKQHLCLFHYSHIKDYDTTPLPYPMKCICGCFYNDDYIKDIQLHESENFKYDTAITTDVYGEILHRRGVTVEFLILFTKRYNCMNWPTWRVVEYVIKPNTLKLKCRYVELSHMCHDDDGIVGPTDVFISHCWGGSWGTLVACAQSKLHLKTKIWCDIFAVRQWPGSGCDLAFQEVVRRCKGLLLVISSFEKLHGDTFVDLILKNVKDIVNEQDRKKIPFLRVWCLVEIQAAIAHSIPILLLCGYNLPNTIDLKVNLPLIYKLHYLVDIENAEATQMKDIAIILTQIKDTLGFTTVNRMIRGSIMGTLLGSMCPKISLAAIGQYSTWFQDIKTKYDSSGEQLQSIADEMIAIVSFGYKDLLNTVLKWLPQAAFVQDSYKKSLLLYASQCGHVHCIKLLLQYNADINHTCTSGMSALCHGAAIFSKEETFFMIEQGADMNGPIKAPLFFASQFGNLSMCEALVQCGADTCIKDPEVGYTPIREAVYFGYLDIADLLLNNGADIHTRDNWNQTILHWAVMNPLKPIDCTKFVLEHGSRICSTATMENLKGDNLKAIQPLLLQYNVTIEKMEK